MQNDNKNYFIKNFDITTQIDVNYQQNDFKKTIKITTNPLIILLKQE